MITHPKRYGQTDRLILQVALQLLHLLLQQGDPILHGVHQLLRLVQLQLTGRKHAHLHTIVQISLLLQNALLHALHLPYEGIVLLRHVQILHPHFTLRRTPPSWCSRTH